MQARIPGQQAAALARLVLPITLAACALPALAQQAPDEAPATSPSRAARMQDRQARSVLKTYYLHNTYNHNDDNEILVALRNMVDPSVKIYLVASKEAIELYAPPEDQAIAQRIIDDPTHPRKAYRLVYTLTTTEDGKTLPPEHVELDALDGMRTTFKQGSKIPVLTGSYGGTPTSTRPGEAGVQTQFTYLDVGINIDSTVQSVGDVLSLRVKVERSGVAPDKSSLGDSDPTVEQSVIETVTSLTPGKTVRLGSVDSTGSHRHTEIEVIAEPRR